jgi:hypothetical protein
MELHCIIVRWSQGMSAFNTTCCIIPSPLQPNELHSFTTPNPSKVPQLLQSTHLPADPTSSLSPQISLPANLRILHHDIWAVVVAVRKQVAAQIVKSGKGAAIGEVQYSR